MFFNWLVLPETWEIQLKTPIGEMFSDIAPLLFIVIGIFLGVYIIEEIVSIFAKKE